MLNKPPTPKAKVFLTPEQRTAYDKLIEGLRAIGNLDAGDTETLLAWDPVGINACLEGAAYKAIKAIHEFDDRTWPDERTMWDELIDAKLLKAS